MKSRKTKLRLTEEDITRLINHLDLTKDTFLADNYDWDDETDPDELCDKLEELRIQIRKKPAKKADKLKPKSVRPPKKKAKAAKATKKVKAVKATKTTKATKKVKAVKATKTAKVTKITVLDYPKTFSFETDVKLPPFKCDPKNKGFLVRTKIVQKKLAQIRYNAPHAPTDFIVEVVEKTKAGENWDLGS